VRREQREDVGPNPSHHNPLAPPPPPLSSLVVGLKIGDYGGTEGGEVGKIAAREEEETKPN